MAQENFYRDKDKNLYEIPDLTKKYLRPINHIRYFLSNQRQIDDGEVIGGAYSAVISSLGESYDSELSNYILNIVEVSFGNNFEAKLFTSSSRYFTIRMILSGYTTIALSAQIQNENMTSLNTFLFPQVDDDEVEFRSNNATSPSTNSLGTASMVFAVFSNKGWSLT